MKKFLPVVALGLLGLTGLGNSALAATTNNPFTVTANLTAQCLVNTAAGNLDFGIYTAFGSASTPTPTTAVSFKCTKGTALTSVAFDTINGTAAGAGVVMGLAYTMTASAASTAPGIAAVVGTGTGATADIQTYTVTGAMAPGQPGAGSGAGTSARSLILTY